MRLPISQRFKELLFVVFALGVAALAGYSIARFVYGNSLAEPGQLAAEKSSMTASISTAVTERRTAVLGESNTLREPNTTLGPHATAVSPESSVSSAPSTVLDATSTPLPNTSATAAPLATPLAPTTEQIKAERLVEDSFASTSSGWIIRDAPTWKARYIDGQYELALTGQQNLHLSSPIPEGDYQLAVDVAITQGGAGVVFLAAKPATFYRFMINQDGLYALQIARQGEVRDVIGWTASDSLRHQADSNQRLRIERQHQTMQFFANEQLLLQWPIPDGEIVNQYGFAITAQQGAARATFDNLVVERLLRP